MSILTESLVFTFPNICETCREEEFTKEGEKVRVTYQTTLQAIQDTGWPVCQLCGEDVYVADHCEVRVGMKRGASIDGESCDSKLHPDLQSICQS